MAAPSRSKGAHLAAEGRRAVGAAQRVEAALGHVQRGLLGDAAAAERVAAARRRPHEVPPRELLQAHAAGMRALPEQVGFETSGFRV